MLLRTLQYTALMVMFVAMMFAAALLVVAIITVLGDTLGVLVLMFAVLLLGGYAMAREDREKGKL